MAVKVKYIASSNLMSKLVSLGWGWGSLAHAVCLYGIMMRGMRVLHFHM